MLFSCYDEEEDFIGELWCESKETAPKEILMIDDNGEEIRYTKNE